MFLNNGKSVESLNFREKNLIIDGFSGNALQRYWDRLTENDKVPDAISLAEAREVINTFIIESGLDKRLLRIWPPRGQQFAQE